MNGVRAPLRAVAFDVDGVLVEIRFPAVLRHALRLSPDATSEFFDGPFVGCLLGRESIDEVLPPYLDKWGWDRTLDEFMDFWFDEESRICAAVVDAVDRLQRDGLRCFLASTQEHRRADFLEHLLEVGSRFERGFFSCRMGCRKPEAAFFEGILTEAGLRPGEIALIDDQIANVEGARRMGWRAAHFRIGNDIDRAVRSLELS